MELTQFAARASNTGGCSMALMQFSLNAEGDRVEDSLQHNAIYSASSYYRLRTVLEGHLVQSIFLVYRTATLPAVAISNQEGR